VFKPFLEDAENLDALKELLRHVAVPEHHTGRLTLQLHFRDGVIVKGDFDINNIRVGGGRHGQSA
jgi:hypothetical protein